ncbi:MAG: hypothetical protein MUQ25_04245 [Candidatus Aminicenantes bacterium]|nr:hypothetical protein [Candidatus Aminicenantes bacterium]
MGITECLWTDGREAEAGNISMAGDPKGQHGLAALPEDEVRIREFRDRSGGLPFLIYGHDHLFASLSDSEIHEGENVSLGIDIEIVDEARHWIAIREYSLVVELLDFPSIVDMDVSLGIDEEAERELELPGSLAFPAYCLDVSACAIIFLDPAAAPIQGINISPRIDGQAEAAFEQVIIIAVISDTQVLFELKCDLAI